MRFAVIGVVLAALLLGGLLYFWTEHGVKENMPPNLGDLIMIKK